MADSFSTDVLSTVLSRKIVSDGQGSYTVKVDLRNIDTIQVNNNFLRSGVVAVGDDPLATKTILYSYDGQLWSPIKFGGFTSGGGNGVAFSGDKWVAVGPDTLITKTIQWSDDGKNWYPINIGGFSSYGNNVTYSLTTWIAVGKDAAKLNTIQLSNDGKIWNPITLGGFSTEGRGIAYNGTLNRWVAVGQDATNHIQWSDDGKRWNAITSGGFPTAGNGGYAVAFNGSIWVAVGNGNGTALNTIQWSDDGKIWNSVTSGGFPTSSGSGFAIAWNGSLWLAGGFLSGSSRLISTQWSKDGKSWNYISAGGFSGGVNGFTWTGSQWLAVGNTLGLGNQTSIQTSSDGKNWFNVASDTFTSIGRGISAGFISSGEGPDGATGSIGATGGASTVTGPTGPESTVTGPTGPAGSPVLFSTTNIIGVGTKMFMSKDDGPWIIPPINSSFFNNTYSIAYNGSLWVAVGDGIATSGEFDIQCSRDGVTWNRLPPGFGFPDNGFGVATDGQLWVAVGGYQRGDYASTTTRPVTIQNSINPEVSWANASDGGFTTVGRSVAYTSRNGGLWVAVGDDITPSRTIQWSRDGKSWSAITSGAGFARTVGRITEGWSVATNGSRWVAVGSSMSKETSIQWSDNGKDWNNCLSGGWYESAATDHGGRAVATNGSRWVALGLVNVSSGSDVLSTIQWSDDGKSWNNCTSGSFGFGTNGDSVTWDGTKWLAVSHYYPTAKYSLDGKTWDVLTIPGIPPSQGITCVATSNKWANFPGTNTALGLEKMLNKLYFLNGAYI